MTRYLEVIVEVPNEASVQATKDYCRDELQAMGGSRHPDDPLFHSVRVHSIRSVRLTKDGPKNPSVRKTYANIDIQPK